VGPNKSHVTCTCGIFLHLHPTCGTRRLACHLLPPGFNKFKQKTMRPGSRTRDPEQGIDRLHHCARRLVVLTCLWSPNSSICSLCGQVDLYIGCIPCKWKQICACWTCDGGSGRSPVCCGDSGILLEARRWVFLVERVALVSVSVVCHGRVNRSDLQASFLAFSCSLHYFGPCLNMRYTRNIVALQIWLDQC
jgi:hypothetical protein